MRDHVKGIISDEFVTQIIYLRSSLVLSRRFILLCARTEENETSTEVYCSGNFGEHFVKNDLVEALSFPAW